MAKKTIGQIAYDIMRERYPERLPPWGADHVVCEDYEAAATAVWNEAVRKCIQEVESEMERLRQQAECMDDEAEAYHYNRSSVGLLCICQRFKKFKR